MTALQALRTALFYLFFMGQTVILAVIVGLIAISFRRRTAVSWAIAQYWRNSSLAFLRLFVGLRTLTEGEHNIPPGAAIIASKHQSDWDVFAILPGAGRPAFIAKRELIDIPFFGWAARSIDTISIDRKLGAQAIPRMLDEARAAVARGCRIIIFPEGTRKAPLAPPDYRQGIVRLYLALDVPVVPVALDSGLYWGRNSPVLWPGTARARYLPAIPPGLDAATFMARLQDAIETETTRMLAEAVERGIVRPLSAGFRTELAARAQAAGAAAPSTY